MTNMKTYKSLEEINQELEIYKLQAQIDKEKMKQNYYEIKDSVSPTNIALDVSLSIVRKLLYGRLFQKLLPFRK
ncbi:hypothetical protein GCM10011312_00720 [Planktosalinus lacus]|uniref:Uncharacterized protein n=2 Tax=Planktosalinus lacus TaxID=1526573 RepID=A0A8J2V829_9FLAO|nr:hypothetical protein GCM10011312_00720 [Planktosalinus lacus]